MTNVGQVQRTEKIQVTVLAIARGLLVPIAVTATNDGREGLRPARLTRGEQLLHSAAARIARIEEASIVLRR